MRLTDGALSMLLKRYRSVLKKCHLSNWLAGAIIASSMALGAPAQAVDLPATWNTTIEITSDVTYTGSGQYDNETTGNPGFVVNNNATLTLDGATIDNKSNGVNTIVDVKAGKLVVNDNSKIVLSTNNSRSPAQTSALVIAKGAEAELTGPSTTIKAYGEDPNGTAIYNEGSTSLNFVQVKEGASKNGSIYNTGSLTMEGAKINSNGAVNEGSGIYNTGSLTIKGAQFDDNSLDYAPTTRAYTEKGGAIASYGSMVISNGSRYDNNNKQLQADQATEFTRNYAQNGGAIAILGAGDNSITGANFRDNHANSPSEDVISRGGAIFMDAPGASLEVKDAIFNANKVENVVSGNIIMGGGGAIFASQDTKLAISGSEFKYNESVGNGGAILSNTALNIDGSTFFDNTSNDGKGGAISLEGFDGGAIIKNTEFSSSTARYNLTENNDIFGGAIYVEGQTSDSSLTISGSTFNRNNADGNGGAIYLKQGKLSVSDTKFNQNQSNYRQLHADGGGALFLAKGTETTLTDTLFASNQSVYDSEASESRGGAIYNEGSLSISSSTDKANDSDKQGFTGNQANQGGAIYSSGSLTINEGVVFANNTSNGRYEDTIQGGAIYITKDAGENSFTGAQFTENGTNSSSGINQGGAIYNASASLKISGTTFTGNVAAEGAAIYNSGQMTLDGNTFKDNSLIGEEGKGALFNSGTATFTGANTFSGTNFSGIEMPDIYNSGTIIIASGETSLESGQGITNTGDVQVQKNGTLKFTSAGDISTSLLAGGKASVDGKLNLGEEATIKAGLLQKEAAAGKIGLGASGEIIASNLTLGDDSFVPAQGTLTATTLNVQDTFTVAGGTINVGQTLNGKTLNVKGGEVNLGSESEATGHDLDSVNVSGGKLDFNNGSNWKVGTLTATGGETTSQDNLATDKLTVSAGTVTLGVGSSATGADLGQVSVSGGSLELAHGAKWSATNLDNSKNGLTNVAFGLSTDKMAVSGGTVNLGTDATATGGSLGTVTVTGGEMNIQNGDWKAAKVDAKGGKLTAYDYINTSALNLAGGDVILGVSDKAKGSSLGAVVLNSGSLTLKNGSWSSSSVAASGGSLTAEKNLSNSGVFNVSGTAKVNLGTDASATGGSLGTVTVAGGEMNIQNGDWKAAKVDAKGGKLTAYDYINTSALNLAGGDVILGLSDKAKGSSLGDIVLNSGSLTLKNGSWSTSSVAASGGVLTAEKNLSNSGTFDVSGTAKINLGTNASATGGNLGAVSISNGALTLKNGSWSSASVSASGGTFTAEKNLSNSGAFDVSGTAKINLGTDASATGGNLGAVSISNGALTLKNGSWSSASVAASGGTFTAEKNLSNSGAFDVSGTAKVNLGTDASATGGSLGSVSVAGGEMSIQNGDWTAAKVDAKGGSLTASDFIDSPILNVSGGNVTYGVADNAKGGNLNAVSISNGALTLKNGSWSSSSVAASGGIFTAEKNLSNSGAFDVSGTAKVNLGTDASATGGSLGAVTVAGGEMSIQNGDWTAAKVDAKGGSVTASDFIDSPILNVSGGNVTYGVADNAKGGNLNAVSISNGALTLKNGSWSSSSVVASGGTFTAEKNLSNSGAFDVSGTAKVNLGTDASAAGGSLGSVSVAGGEMSIQNGDWTAAKVEAKGGSLTASDFIDSSILNVSGGNVTYGVADNVKGGNLNAVSISNGALSLKNGSWSSESVAASGGTFTAEKNLSNSGAFDVSGTAKVNLGTDTSATGGSLGSVTVAGGEMNIHNGQWKAQQIEAKSGKLTAYDTIDTANLKLIGGDVTLGVASNAKGANLGDLAINAGTLTLKNGDWKADSVAANGGTFTAEKNLSNSGAFNVSGSAKVNLGTNAAATGGKLGAVTVAGGEMSIQNGNWQASSVKATGGTLTAADTLQTGKWDVAGGQVNLGAAETASGSNLGDVAISSGGLKVTHGNGWSMDKLSVTGGSLDISGDGVIVTVNAPAGTETNFAYTGGTINVDESAELAANYTSIGIEITPGSVGMPDEAAIAANAQWSQPVNVANGALLHITGFNNKVSYESYKGLVDSLASVSSGGELNMDGLEWILPEDVALTQDKLMSGVVPYFPDRDLTEITKEVEGGTFKGLQTASETDGKGVVIAGSDVEKVTNLEGGEAGTVVIGTSAGQPQNAEVVAGSTLNLGNSGADNSGSMKNLVLAGDSVLNIQGNGAGQGVWSMEDLDGTEGGQANVNISGTSLEAKNIGGKAAIGQLNINNGKVGATSINAAKNLVMDKASLAATTLQIQGDAELADSSLTLTGTGTQASRIGGNLVASNMSEALTLGDLTVGGTATITNNRPMNISAGNLSLGADKSGTSRILGGGNVDISGTLTVNGALVLGSSTDATPVNLTAKTADLQSGRLIFDPAFGPNGTGNTGSATIQQLTKNIADFDVLQNYQATIGTNDKNWLPNAISAYGLGFGRDINNPNLINSALGLAMPITIAKGGAVMVDGSHTNVADRVVLAAGERDKARFGAGSLLVVNGNAEGVSYTGSKRTDLPGAISSASSAEATVEAGAKLLIDGVSIGKTYVILGQGMTATTLAGWQGSDLLGGDPITRLTLVDPGTVNGQAQVATQLISSGEFFPGLDSELVTAIDNAMLAGQVHPWFADSANGKGARFLSRALMASLDGQGADASKTIESAARMAVIGAVPQMTKAASDAAGSAVTTRLGFANPTGQLMEQKASPDSSFALWIMPIFQSTNGFGMEAGNFDYDFSGSLGGVALGGDYTFANNIRAGLLFNIGGGYAKGSGDLNDTDNNMNFWGLGAYAGWSQNNFALTADFNFTSTYNKLKQDLPGWTGWNEFKSDITAWALSMGLRGEYKIETDYLDIVPHVSVRYINLNVDEYDITNSGDVLKGDSFSQNIWTFPVGVNFSKEFQFDNGWSLRPNLDFTIIPAAGDIKAKNKVRFTGTGTEAELDTKMMDYFTYGGSAGVEFGTENMSFGINYTAQFGAESSAHGVFGTFRYEF